MDLIFLLFVVGGSTLCAWALRRQRQHAKQHIESLEQRKFPLEQFKLERLEPQDVLGFEGTDWIVLGVAHFSDGENNWVEYRLVDGEEERWLLVASNTGSTLWGERTSDPGVATHPSENLEYQHKIYRLQSYGRAVIESAGRIGELYSAHGCHYWDYTRAGSERFWIRNERERWEYFAGRTIARHFLVALPGS